MSFSKKVTAFNIKVAVLIIRLIWWLQSGNIKKCKIKSNAFKEKTLTGYFARKYLPAIKNISQQPIVLEIPETIWQFWDNPPGQTTPEIVKVSVESVERFKGYFDHKVLNGSTIKNYSDLPGYIFDRLKRKKMIYAHFADLLRLNLLKNHGGVWMDATDYMTDFVPEYIIKQDFFVFLTGNLTHFPYSFMQNFFIRAKKGSFLCEAWYQMCLEYWKNETKSIDYFQHQIMFKSLVLKHPVAQRLFAEMPHISEDETLQFIGDNLFQKFDTNTWKNIKKTSFFQKTTYRIAGGKIIGAVDYPNTYFSKLCERGPELENG